MWSHCTLCVPVGPSGLVWLLAKKKKSKFVCFCNANKGETCCFYHICYPVKHLLKKFFFGMWVIGGAKQIVKAGMLLPHLILAIFLRDA